MDEKSVIKEWFTPSVIASVIIAVTLAIATAFGGLYWQVADLKVQQAVTTKSLEAIRDNMATKADFANGFADLRRDTTVSVQREVDRAIVRGCRRIQRKH